MKLFKRKPKKDMVEVPPEGLYGFKDFSQIIKAIADINTLNNAVYGSLGLREQMQELRDRIDAIEHSAANVTKMMDGDSKLAQKMEILEKDIDSLSDKSEKQADNIDRIWGMMGRVTARSQELEDHITGEDTQLKRDEYDVEPDIV